MNLFFLDIDPKKCAEYHCDKHVVKMILELVQMLYTAHNVLQTQNLPTLKEHGFDSYRSFSPKHPTCIWIRQCEKNYIYACNVGMYLCEEYTYRYKKTHTCEQHIDWLIKNIPNKFQMSDYTSETVLSYNKEFQALGHTPVPLAMYTDVKYPDTFKSYRFYYIVYKRRFAKWTGRSNPWWYTSGNYKLINNFK
jgi:hypothetical protein